MEEHLTSPAETALENICADLRAVGPPADYKTNTVMAAASKALLASGMNPQPGEKVQMIIVDSGARGQITKAIPYTPAVETLDSYDTGKYAELLIRAAESVLLRKVDAKDSAIDTPAMIPSVQEVFAFS